MSPIVSSLLGPALSLFITIVGGAVTYGRLRDRVETHQKEIDALREKQDSVATKEDTARIERRLETLLSAVLRPKE